MRRLTLTRQSTMHHCFQRLRCCRRPDRRVNVACTNLQVEMLLGDEGTRSNFEFKIVAARLSRAPSSLLNQVSGVSCLLFTRISRCFRNGRPGSRARAKLGHCAVQMYRTNLSEDGCDMWWSHIRSSLGATSRGAIGGGIQIPANWPS